MATRKSGLDRSQIYQVFWEPEDSIEKKNTILKKHDKRAENLPKRYKIATALAGHYSGHNNLKLVGTWKFQNDNFFISHFYVHQV